MNKDNKTTNEYITKKDLEDQVGVIIEALDGRFNKIENRLDEVRDELKTDINNVQTLIDGYVKAQEDFKQEFVIIKEEVRQMKQIFKEKLGVEIRAI